MNHAVTPAYLKEVRRARARRNWRIGATLLGAFAGTLAAAALLVVAIGYLS